MLSDLNPDCTATVPNHSSDCELSCAHPERFMEKNKSDFEEPNLQGCSKYTKTAKPIAQHLKRRNNEKIINV